MATRPSIEYFFKMVKRAIVTTIVCRVALRCMATLELINYGIDNVNP